MIKNDYEVKYPLDAVSVEKFSELLGKAETAVRKMIINNKLPVVELTDPEVAAAPVGESWVVISEFNRRVLEAYTTVPQKNVMLGLNGLGCNHQARNLNKSP